MRATQRCASRVSRHAPDSSLASNCAVTTYKVFNVSQVPIAQGVGERVSAPETRQNAQVHNDCTAQRVRHVRENDF